jgi:hypothetical protein
MACSKLCFVADGGADHELLLDFMDAGLLTSLCIEYRLPLGLSIWPCALLTADVSNIIDFLFLKPVIRRKPFLKPDPPEPFLESFSEMVEGAVDCVGDFSENWEDCVTGRRSLEEQDVGAVDSESMEV